MNIPTPTTTDTDTETALTTAARLEVEIDQLEQQLRTARNRLDVMRRRIAKDLCKGPILGKPSMKIARRSL